MQRFSELQAARRGAGAGHGAQLGAGLPVDSPKGESRFAGCSVGGGAGARFEVFTGAGRSTGQQPQLLE
jgi:hypothetical protein